MHLAEQSFHLAHLQEVKVFYDWVTVFQKPVFEQHFAEKGNQVDLGGLVFGEFKEFVELSADCLSGLFRIISIPGVGISEVMDKFFLYHLDKQAGMIPAVKFEV